jgi:hypothetical protein
MDAGDQRDRQQFHNEAKISDAVQAPVFTGWIDSPLLRAFENIEIGASREVPKAAG